jgi:hypothetical protein
MLINRYAIFVRDIEPKCFDLVVMDGYLTQKNVLEVREILTSSARREQIVKTNYEIATRYYSFAVLRRWLNTLLVNFFGVDMWILTNQTGNRTPGLIGKNHVTGLVSHRKITGIGLLFWQML